MQQTTNPTLFARHLISRRHFLQLVAAGVSTTALLAACAPPGVAPATGSESAAEGGETAAAGVVHWFGFRTRKLPAWVQMIWAQPCKRS